MQGKSVEGVIYRVAPHATARPLLLLLLICLVQINGAAAISVEAAARQCQNGAEFDKVMWTCHCTPEFYGPYCETSFLSLNPCTNPSIPELNDAAGAHSPENNQSCSGSGGCISFATITPGWYRLKSPAGGVLTTACPSSPSSCGSARPYALTSIVQEANVNRDLRSGRLYRVSGEPPNCYDTASSYYRVRILRCATFTVYYLKPTMSRREHYCIGGNSTTEVVVVDLHSTGSLCSSSNCTAIYLRASPHLRSENSTCVIRSTGSEGFEERRISEPLTSNVVGCPMAGALSWIKTKQMLYIAVSVQLVAIDWSSENSATALVYQDSCKDGRAVCSSSTMTCSIAAPKPSTGAQLTNVCEPSVHVTRAPKGANAISGSASLTILLLVFGVQLAGYYRLDFCDEEL